MSQDSRRRGMAGYSPEAVQFAEVGKMMGRLVRDHYAATYQAFVTLAVVPPQPLLNLVLWVAHTRIPFRTRPGGGTVLEELVRVPRRRWGESLLVDSWAVYRSLRAHACPQAPQPTVQPEDVPLHFTREVARFLRPSGVRPENREWSAAVRHALANEQMAGLWAEMAHRPVVLWYDNFFKRLYHATPRDPMVSFNTTVMAVMRPQVAAPRRPGDPLRLPEFEGYPSVEQLWQRHLELAEELTALATDRLPALLNAISAAPLRPEEFRVPLDVPRDQARAPVWRPFSLSSDVVSSQVGMLRVLRFLRDGVLPHVAPQPCLPLLVDENLWYRQLKLVYGREAQQWDAATALGQLPPLYGVWHPYKQVLHVLYRRLLPLFVYVQKGTLAPGAVWTEHPKLRTLESWIGALLMLPEDRRLRGRAMLDRLRRRRATVQADLPDRENRALYARTLMDQAIEKADTLRQRAARRGTDLRPEHREALQRALDLEAHNKRAWQQVEDQRKRAVTALRVLRRDVAIAEAFVDLLHVWAPACFALGWRVRDCHWAHREPGTGAYALEVLRTALILLVHLESPAPVSRPVAASASSRGGAATAPPASQARYKGTVSEYVRTMSCAGAPSFCSASFVRGH